MSEELNQAVPGTSAQEAVPPVKAIDSDDPVLLRNKIELAKGDTAKAVAEKQALKKQIEDMQRQMSELQNSQQKAKQAQLAESGEFKTLWEQAAGTVSSLKEEIAQRDQKLSEMQSQFQQSQIRAAASSLCQQSGVLNADIMLSTPALQNLKLEDGQVVAMSGGVPVPLQQHLDSLKQQGSGYEFMFNSSGARGMSATGSAPNTTGGKSWSSMSLSEKILAEERDAATGSNTVAQLKSQG